MSGTQTTVTSTQVAVKYRRKVSSLSIDMSADNRTTTLGRHIDQHIGRVSVDISTGNRPICRSICRRGHFGQYFGLASVDMSSIGRYVDRYIGRGRGAQNTHDPPRRGKGISFFYTSQLGHSIDHLLLTPLELIHNSVTQYEKRVRQ